MRIDWRTAILLVASTLSLVFERYNNIFQNKVMDRVLWFFIVPILIVLLVFRRPLTDYGVQIGDWKFGLLAFAASIPILILIIKPIASTPDFQNYYGNLKVPPPALVANLGLDMLGWEFLFRGFMLFGLLDVLGPIAIFLQAVPFTIAHFGKPMLETVSCIFGGTAFGYLAWRTKSYFYPFLIHWVLLILIYLLASGAI